MPKLIVFKCDHPECTEVIEINSLKLEPFGIKAETPEDWDIQHNFGISAESAKVFCPKHNVNIESQREWREFQKRQQAELDKNPPTPKGGLLPSRCPNCEPKYGKH